MTTHPQMRRVVISLAVLSVAAPSASAAELEVEVTTPPDPPPAEALTKDHPAVATKWARTFQPYEPLLKAPGEESAQIAESPGARTAARVQRVSWDDEGRPWARLAYPGGVRGWVAAKHLRSVPEVTPLSPRLRRSLRRVSAKAGRTSSMVVRDRFGRTLYSAGTKKPLVLASVTKIFTVGAALERLEQPSLAREILAPSNNSKAQRLIEWIGQGSNGKGTKAAELFAKGVGALVDLADGSGLDARNRAAGSEVVDYLQAMREHPRYRIFKRGLSVLGRNGTLGGRLTGARTKGRVQAKTGTLFFPSTSTLAGYLQPRGAKGPNQELTFAMLMNGIPYLSGRRLQDEMLHLLITRR